MIPVLRNKFKDKKIIVLHIDGKFSANENHTNTAVLNSTETTAVQNFLEKEIPETGASLIRVIEWRPSLNLYKESYVKLLSIAAEFLKRNDAEKRTVSFFGRRWVKNFFKNLANLEKILLYKNTDIPVIVTGSGPGLETALPMIKEYQESCPIIAASSSVMALEHYNISPDIVISTDGGAWALRHIYPFYRKYKPSALAVNLYASLPSQCKSTPQLIINDGSFFQNIILHELKIPSVIIRQKGTVTASAIELAMILSSGNIYIAGVDLSVSGIRTHARPYGFDSIFFENANRLTPVYSQFFERSSLLKDGGSMNVYAAWFKDQLSIWSERIYSLTESRIFKNSIPDKLIDKKNNEKYFSYITIKKDNGSFYKRGVSALLNAIDGHVYGENLKTELAPLLFPGKNNITKDEIKTVITETTARYDNE